MKTLRCLSLLILVFFATGCAQLSMSPVGPGVLFTSADGPLVVGPSETATKTGEACAMNVLGLISVGDASISSAATTAGITKIQAVDYNSFSILSLFAKTCTVVNGD